MANIPRSLAYNDLWVWYIEQDWANSDCEGSPILLDEAYNYIALELTAEQWQILFSCILTGGDLVYPENSQEVAWWWLKGVECAMAFCDKVLTCFNDASFVNSFVEKLAQQGVGLGSTGSTGSATTSDLLGSILPLDFDCDNDEALFGFCMQVVDTLNNMFVDYLEIVETYTNAIELGARLMGLIPIFGDYAEKAIETADKTLENIAETYMASYTLEVQETIACQLYQIAKENCSLTFDNIIEAYGDVITEPVSDVFNFQTAIDIFLGLPTATATAVVIASHALPLTVMNFSQSWLGYTARSFPVYSGAFSDYPVPEDCEITWCIEWDFTADNPLTNIRGNYSAGVGYKPAQYTASGNRINRYTGYVTFDLREVTRIWIEYDATVLQNDASFVERNKIVIFLDEIELLDYNEVAPLGTYTNEVWDTGVISYACNRIDVQVIAGSKTGTGAFSGSNAGDCTLLKLHIEGIGTNPFGASNC